MNLVKSTTYKSELNKIITVGIKAYLYILSSIKNFVNYLKSEKTFDQKFPEYRLPPNCSKISGSRYLSKQKTSLKC